MKLSLISFSSHAYSLIVLGKDKFHLHRMKKTIQSFLATLSTTILTSVQNGKFMLSIDMSTKCRTRVRELPGQQQFLKQNGSPRLLSFDITPFLPQ